MLVIQNFSNLKHQKKFYETEILIWATGLLKYKSFGYKTKLYCTEEEIPFLKEWGLYDLYDEIDSTFFNSWICNLGQVNEERFWSTRKIEALYHELIQLENKEPVIYSDTDIIMEKPFNIEDQDCLFWSPEHWEDDVEGNVYVNWDILSKPMGYELPEYLKKVMDAYNCGILYFRDPKVFEEYRAEYFTFVIGNPCELIPQEGMDYDYEDLKKRNNVWACNAEQRILRGVIEQLGLKPAFVMDTKKDGVCENGIHYFIYRMCWKELDKYFFPPVRWLEVLNDTVRNSLQFMHDNYPEKYEFWNSRPWLINKDMIHPSAFPIFKHPIRKYYQ